MPRLAIYMIDQGCLTPAYDVELCRALSLQGHSVTLINAPYQNDPHYKFPGGFETIPLFFAMPGLARWPRLRRILKGLSYPFYYLKLEERLLQSPVEVLHFQWSLIPPIDLLFIRRFRRRLPGLSIILTVHDVHPAFSLVGKRYLKRLILELDGIIVHGEKAKWQLLERMPDLEDDRIAVIPHGPLHRPGQHDNDVTEARRLVGVPAQGHVGMMFGEIKLYKGLDTLVSALQALPLAQTGKLSFLVAGKLEDQSCLAQLKQFEELALETFLRTGYVETQNLTAYFSSADFVVLPYRQISQSGVLLTAIGSGVPVIVTDVGEMGPLVRATGAGWVIPPDDPTALASAINEALALSRADLQKMGEAARHNLEREHGWCGIAQQTLALYEKNLNCEWRKRSESRQVKT